MSRKIINILSGAAISVLLLLFSSCNLTRHLKDDQYLLNSNTVKLKTNKGVTRRGELKDNLESLIVQKPNTRILLGVLPLKLWLYNLRYERYQKDTSNYQIKFKTVEPPVLYDSNLTNKTVRNLKSYLFNSGYFYPTIRDTVIFKDKKAYATYEITTGINYLINKVSINVDDTAIKRLLEQSMSETQLKTGANFYMSLVEEERSRIANVLKENGYYFFTQENVVDVKLDTFNKALLKDEYSPFENIINTIALPKQKQKNPTLDITIYIRTDNPKAYKRYFVNRISVFPDFISREASSDSAVITKLYQNFRFRYHHYYIREKVLYKSIFFENGTLTHQSDYDNTINKLNDLGVFKSVRIVQFEDTVKTSLDSGFINTAILLSPAKKYDFSTNFEISNGTTYFAGSALAFTFRDRNFLKGGNVLNISLRGGLESNLDQYSGKSFFNRFQLFSRNAGINASLNFPKFIVPFNIKFKNKNAPRTIISAGANILERVDLFTATTITGGYTYTWRQTATQSWEVSPMLFNNFRLPFISDSFQKRLDTVEFLNKLYTPVFIEGENISYIYTDQFINKGRSYSYAKISLEEAGGLMSGIQKIGNTKFNYAQYLKLDFDLRRYTNRPRSQWATRFYGGFGIPYGHSLSLPYIKQYFTGGPYSIRGWRVRTLGPGGYYNPSEDSTHRAGVFIDRTGDIKLELNTEYRFDIVQLFYGVIKMKGALFADAGNIWLAKKTPGFDNGEFKFSKLGKELAVSAGVGLRFDLAGFFIFRADAAFPVKRPYGSNNGWAFEDIALGSGTWRKNNIILNVAIGYPF
ncbi:MAG TPA: BamA/TamA family outer membrane protein [Flavipsychrobacter sp.]|nr:BamA/TamA family outer membrane protein [Flavipsychrobacter sp.]